MKTNLTIRLFDELKRKGYQVVEIPDKTSEMLRVVVYTSRYNMPFSIDLIVPISDNPMLGFAYIHGLNTVSPEKRGQAIEYINSINSNSQLTFIINDQNVVAIKQSFYSTTNHLFEQYISFIELFSFFFENNNIMCDLNSLISL